MFQNIKTKSTNKLVIGFTLVELLVAITIIASISLISVRGLYDIVGIRAKQETLEDSSNIFRTFIQLLTKSTMTSLSISIPNSSEIRIAGADTCETFKFDVEVHKILHSKVESNPCIPPETGFTNILGDDLEITNLLFSPVGSSVDVVEVELEGFRKSSLGDHPVKYKTSITPRI